VLYLQELEEVLELTQPAEFQLVIDPLFARINRCIMSLHFQVAERALFYWNNEYIASYITQYRHRILPIVISGLMSNTKGHWNMTVYQMTYNVVKMFNDMDPQLFDETIQSYKKKTEQ
jgi:serine/threonine-protein phosphatase 2A regulatory subunit B'